MYKKKKFSEDEIKKANEVSILSLVKNLGLKTEKKKNAYKAPGYGGLYIDEYCGTTLWRNNLWRWAYPIGAIYSWI